MRTPTLRPIVKRFLFSATLATGLLFATNALAGEMKFGEGSASLQTDDSGKLTDGGKKSSIKEIDKVPGEDVWDLKIWMQIKGAAGPLYVEFYQTVQGQESIVHREDIPYEGEKFITASVPLEGGQGFNKNRTYRVQAIQNDGKRDIKLAGATIKLINTGRKPEKGEGDGEGGEDTEGEEEVSEQDVLDTLAGPDEDGGDDPGDADPPTTDSPTKKKGCSVTGDADLGFSGLMVLVLAGIGMRRERRRS
jgi:MYXO-CTERM domain-containing protein